MAFASTKVKRAVIGNLRITCGTFTNGAADAGGAIATGLKKVYSFSAEFNSHLGSEPAKHTISAGTVTIVTSTGADGIWTAIGF